MRTVLDWWFLSLVSFCCWQGYMYCSKKKFLVRFSLRRSWRGENLMELRNSVWNELCTTVGRTTIKMNAHFVHVPQFFICLQAVNTHKVCWLACMLVPPQDFPFLASWGMVTKNIWGSKRCKVEHNTNYADKIVCIKEIEAVYIQTFSKLLVFCPLNDNTATDFCARIVSRGLFISSCHKPLLW